MRDPNFNSKMTELYVLIGDLVTMVRRPLNTLSLLKSETKGRMTHRIVKEKRQKHRKDVNVVVDEEW